MHACYILLLAVVPLLASFEAVTASPVLSQTSRASPDTPPSIETVHIDGNSKRSLRNHWTDNEDDRNAGESNTEERGIAVSAKIINTLKNWANKDRKFEQMLTGGAEGDLVLFAKLYSKKASPYRLFTRMNLSALSDAEMKTDEAYLKWAAYFDYWVDRNTGKIKA